MARQAAWKGQAAQTEGMTALSDRGIRIGYRTHEAAEGPAMGTWPDAYY